ncbi:MAG: right-handed parallel beta-helix repeat-containing protein [Myxococcota bacterium]
MTRIGTPLTCGAGGDDCDDNPAACGAACHPGAVEVCDGWNNDCDAAPAACAGDAVGIDEGCDDDCDDFCDAAMTRVGTPSTCSAGGADCDDDASTCGAACRPGAVEICDGWNNDCDAAPPACAGDAVGVDEGCDDDCDDFCDAAIAFDGAPPTCASGGADCDDSPFACGAACHPGAVEVCDGWNNDCDAAPAACAGDAVGIDEGCDDDCDGFCDAAMTRVGTPSTCASPGADCDDNPAACGAGCHSGAVEICDGWNNDCDAAPSVCFGDVTGVDEGCDDDCDDFCDAAIGFANAPPTCASGGGDCDDNPLACGANCNPAAAEICDGYNNDCDAAPAICPGDVAGVDEGCDDDCDNFCRLSVALIGTPPTCSAGGGDCDDNPAACGAACRPGGVEVCDGWNNDCDAAPTVCPGDSSGVDEGCDDDCDDFCDAAMTRVGTPPTCASPGADCDDNPAACGAGCQPGAAEICDGWNNDCDAAPAVCPGDVVGIDEGCDDDCDNYCQTGIVVVGTPPTCSAGGADCDDNPAACGAACQPGGVEVCDGWNNDCDAAPAACAGDVGGVDEGCDDDCDDFCDAAMTRIGTPPTCASPGADCDDNPATCGAGCRPGAAEICDGWNNDCDAAPVVCPGDVVGIDEGCDDDCDNHCEAGLTMSGTPPTCSAGGADCDDDPAACGAACYPGATEICDGRNNDCDAALAACAGDVVGIDEGCDDDCDGWCDLAITLVGVPPTCASGGGDCDDNPAACGAGCRPGGTEICDGWNNDCDAAVAACAGDVVGVDEACDDDCDNHCEAGLPITGTPPTCSAGGGDCDDDPAACGAACYPGAAEICDGWNNDCDAAPAACAGDVVGSDEGCDDDCDGWCDAAIVRVGVPPTCVSGGGDCDDDPGACGVGCNPSGTEICDGWNNDCDAAAAACPGDAVGIDEGCDDDCDNYCQSGLTVVGTPPTCSFGGGDCDDAPAGCGAACNPGAAEVCDGWNNDCDAAAAACAGDLAGVDEACDDDCDDYCDAAMTRIGTPPTCVAGGGDCDDNPAACGAACRPGAAEICDGWNNDCDAAAAACLGDLLGVDEGCDDDCDDWCDAGMTRVGAPPTCAAGGADCDDNPAACGAACNPGAAEACDGWNNDCDAAVAACAGDVVGIDEGCDDDCDTWCDAAMAKAAGISVPTCASTPAVDAAGDDCDDNPAACGATCNPTATETCNGWNDDCDAAPAACVGDVAGVDEGCDDDCDGWCDTMMAKAGGFAVPTCASTPAPATTGDDCDDDPGACGAACNLGAAEVCDGWNNDCDVAAAACVGDVVGVDEGCDDDCDTWCDIAMAKTTGISVPTCTSTPSANAAGDDCDDNPAACGAACNPTATEICDARNNDCDVAIAACAGDVVGVDEGCDNDCDAWCDSGMAKAAGVSVPTCASTAVAATAGDDCNDLCSVCHPPALASEAGLCDAWDNDCDGTINEGCATSATDGYCEASECATDPACQAAPADCNASGDGVGADTGAGACAGPYPTAADNVYCVSTGACDAFCDTCSPSIDFAFADVPLTVAVPTYIWIAAGAYTQATSGLNIAGKAVTGANRLWIGARCAAGARDAVTVSKISDAGVNQYVLIINMPSVTLEGLRIDVGADTTAHGMVVAGRGDNIILRDLSMTSAVATAVTGYDYLRCDGLVGGAFNADNLLVEDVEVYDDDATTLATGMSFSFCPAFTVRRSAVCRLQTATGADIGFLVGSNGGANVFDRVLARQVKRGFDTNLAASGGSVTLDGVVARDNTAYGGYVTGGSPTVRNSRFTGNAVGLRLDNPTGAEIFNDLFARNTLGSGYGLHVYASVASVRVDRLLSSTFEGNANAGVNHGLFLEGTGASAQVRVGDFFGNLLTGHGGAGDAGVRRAWAPPATSSSAPENRYFANTTNCACESDASCATDPCLEGGAGTTQNPLQVGLVAHPDYLSQPPGQATTSPAVGASSVLSQHARTCSGASPRGCLDARTTSTARGPDTAQADLGFHYPVCADACSGSPEVCNGVDDNCDGIVDEGGICVDADGDGTCGTCGDCDDLDPDRYPGHVEWCDNKDNDCDGLSDLAEGCNDDGDAYCDSAFITIGTPGPPLNCTAGGNDCADTDALVFPGTSCDSPADGDTCNDDGPLTCPGGVYTCPNGGADVDADTYCDIGGACLAACGGDCCASGTCLGRPAANVYPTAPCEGPDTDTCEEDAVSCAGGVPACVDGGTDADSDGHCALGGVCTVACGADCNDDNAWQSPSDPEVCFNGLDDDCNGSPDDACSVCGNDACEASECGACARDCAPAPTACNPDGDALPPAACAGPYPRLSDDVRCVCASGCPATSPAICDGGSFYATIATALAAAGSGDGNPATLDAPTVVLLWPGSYAGATISGKDATAINTLTVAARCASNLRAAVTVTSSVVVQVPYVTLEGFTVAPSASTSYGVQLDGTSATSRARFARLRSLGVTGAVTSAFVYCNGSATYPVDGLLLDEVDVFARGGTAPTYGVRLSYCDVASGGAGATIRRSSACGATSAGYYVDNVTPTATFDRTLALRNGFYGFSLATTAAATGIVLDGVHARGHSLYGAYVVRGAGLVVRNSHFTSNTSSGLYVDDGSVAQIFDNLFASQNYGAWIVATSAAQSAGAIRFNTFADNSNTGLYLSGTATAALTTSDFSDNLFVRATSGSYAVRRVTNVPVAATAAGNRYTAGFAVNICDCSGTPCGGDLNQCLDGASGAVNQPAPVSATSTSGLKYYLDPASTAVDGAASVAPSAACSGAKCLSSRTTRSPGAACATPAALLDGAAGATDWADIGYHYEGCLCQPVEICDLADNDADALIDEGCDDDSDDYCDTLMFVGPGMSWGNGLTCNSPADAAGDDCNDALASISPWALERCDGVDNNCAGTPPIDEGCDDDGDGFCDSGMEKLAGWNAGCSLTPAAAISGDDCNDRCAACQPGAIEICDAWDNDCDATINEGCPMSATDGFCDPSECSSDPACSAAPTDCGVAGDLVGAESGPLTCSGPYPTASDNVYCVSGGACDAFCDTCRATIDAALADVPATFATPTYVWIAAGAYVEPIGGLNVAGKTPTGGSRLWIGARCTAGTRAAVTVTKANDPGANQFVIQVNAPSVTLEGLTIDVGADTTASGVLVASLGDDAILRQLTLTSALASDVTSSAYAYLRCDGTVSGFYATNLLVDRVDVPGADGNTLSYGMYFYFCPDFTVRRSAVCRLETSSDFGFYDYFCGGSTLFDRALARQVGRGFHADVTGADGAVTLDGVVAADESGYGAYVVGGSPTVLHGRFTQSSIGLYLDRPTGGEVFDNQIAGNTKGNGSPTGYGMLVATSSSTAARVNRILFNTFAGNVTGGANFGLFLDGYDASKPVVVDEFYGNLVVGENGAGDRGVGRDFAPLAKRASVSANRYFDDGAGACGCTPFPGPTCAGASDCLEGGTGTLENPLLVAVGADGDYLSQPPGQGVTSPAVNAATILAHDGRACSGASAADCLNARTTSTARALDTANADLGFHHAACP